MFERGLPAAAWCFYIKQGALHLRFENPAEVLHAMTHRGGLYAYKTLHCFSCTFDYRSETISLVEHKPPQRENLKQGIVSPPGGSRFSPAPLMQKRGPFMRKRHFLTPRRMPRLRHMTNPLLKVARFL